MTMRKDTDGLSSDAAAPAVSAAATASPAPVQLAAAPAAALDSQISLQLPEPAGLEPPAAGMTAEPPAIAGAALTGSSPRSELPKAVEAVMAAAEFLRPASVHSAPETPVPEPVIAAAAVDGAAAARSNRFALLAASVAFAGALGAMAGALGTSLLARPSPTEQTPLAALDLTAVQDAIAGLRGELSAIRSSVESGSRNTNAQFAKVGERIERLAQAAPAQRAQAPSADITGSVRPLAAAPVAEPPRQPMIDGWVVRHVSRGVAVIQGRVGAIEVEAGDVVPGLGRIESIRRQDGRWVVLTSKGVIASAAPR